MAASNNPSVLHGYFRSSAAWRVRIALNLKGLPVEQISHHLPRSEQTAPDYRALNPQGLVPALILHDGTVLTQSLAIMEWLDEAFPEPPLLPADPISRARARAFTLVMAADTHPLQNLKILKRLRAAGLLAQPVQDWAAQANTDGLTACEALLPADPVAFCFAAHPGLADICLIPQLASARRFGVDVAQFPRLLAKEAACLALPAFADAAPEKQPDAE
jgi:maleylpyruvate isomerase